MRYFATTALMLIAAQFASARGAPPNAEGVPPQSNFNADRPAISTEELKKRVEAVGFKDVEVVPQMFVVVAKKPDGRSVSMIVDSETLQALQLGTDGPDQGGDDPAAPGAPESSCTGPSHDRT